MTKSSVLAAVTYVRMEYSAGSTPSADIAARNRTMLKTRMTSPTLNR